MLLLLSSGDHQRLLASATFSTHNRKRSESFSLREKYAEPPDPSYLDVDGLQVLMRAAQRGDTETASALINISPSLCWEMTKVSNTPVEQSMNPFMVACQNGFADMVRLMLPSKSKDEAPDENEGITATTPVFGFNALHLAVIGCASQKIPQRQARSWREVVNDTLDLLDKETTEKLLSTQDHQGYTPLMLAAKYGLTTIVHTILSHKYRNHPREKLYSLVNIQGRDRGETALHVAAENYHADVCQILLAAAASPWIRDMFGRSFVNIATMDHAPRVLSVLGQHFKDGKPFNGERASRVWFDKNSAWTLDGVYDAFGTNALMAAAAVLDLGKLCAVQAQCSMDIDEANQFGWTALIYALAADSFTIPQRDAVVSTLLEMGANPNVATIDGLVPLDLCNVLHSSTVQKLLKHGADVNYVSSIDYHTPLHSLLNRDIVNLEIVRLILDAGADVNAATRDGMRPLHIACIRQHARAVSLLLEHPELDVNAQYTVTGENAIIMAASVNNLRIVKLLAARGSDASHKSKRGMTALIYAIHHGNSEMIDFLIRRAGAKFDLRLPESEYALKLAVMSGKVDIVQLLLKLSEPRWRRRHGRQVVLEFAEALMKASISDPQLRAGVESIVHALG